MSVWCLSLTCVFHASLIGESNLVIWFCPALDWGCCQLVFSRDAVMISADAEFGICAFGLHCIHNPNRSQVKPTLDILQTSFYGPCMVFIRDWLQNSVAIVASFFFFFPNLERFTVILVMVCCNSMALGIFFVMPPAIRMIFYIRELRIFGFF